MNWRFCSAPVRPSMPSAFAQRSCSPHMLASFAPLGSPSLMHGSSDFNYIAIHARNVTLSLGSTQILKGIDLSIVRGESLAILRSEEHTSELQSLMRISYAVFCLQHKKKHYERNSTHFCNRHRI